MVEGDEARLQSLAQERALLRLGPLDALLRGESEVREVEVEYVLGRDVEISVAFEGHGNLLISSKALIVLLCSSPPSPPSPIRGRGIRIFIHPLVMGETVDAFSSYARLSGSLTVPSHPFPGRFFWGLSKTDQ